MCFSLCAGIVRFYVQRDIQAEEVKAVLNYTSACSHSEQIVEVLDMVYALLTKAPNKECLERCAVQFAQPGAAQVLLALLQRDEEPVLLITCKVSLSLVTVLQVLRYPATCAWVRVNCSGNV